MKKKCSIKLAWIIVAILLVIPLLFFGILVIYQEYRDMPQLFERNYREDVYIDVPDSDLTLVVKQWYWLHGGGVEFYYVKERKILKDKYIDLGQDTLDSAYYPFETGEYEVINNQNGTFTVRWNKHPSNTSPQHWSEITFDFPS